MLRMPRSKKRKTAACQPEIKLPIALVTITCPDKGCMKCFKTERGLASHFDKSPGCAQAITKVLQCLPTQQLSNSLVQHTQTELESATSADNVSRPTGIGSNATKNEEGLSETNELPMDDLDTDEVDFSNLLENDQEEVQYEHEMNANNTDHGYCFGNEFFFQIKLMKILHNANAPNYLYQQIIEWAQEAQDAQLSFYNVLKSRKGLIHQAENWMPYLKQNAPYTVPTILETPGNPQVVDVTVFDFKKQLLSLLNDRFLFGNIDNLDVNKSDPFARYKTPNNVLSTVNSGMRYKLAYKTCVTCPESDFLVPIIFACNETKVSNQGKAACWPLLFTTSILNQEMRNLPAAWRPLGYIYDVSLTTSTNQEKQFGVDLKYTRLHQILKSILSSYIHCQNSTALSNMKVRLGEISKVVNLKVPCFFIIGDMQGGDKMCCSSPCYSNKLRRLCRKCNVHGKDAGDPSVECKKILMKPIQEMVNNNEKEQLDQLNQYNVQNAWFSVDFGGCPCGIFSAACPVEPLHALENGLIADCLKVLFLKIKSSNELANLDRLAQSLTRLPRQRFASSGSDKSVPRMLWKDGITTLTDLTASCKVGIMFTVVVISLRDDGRAFLRECLAAPIPSVT